MSTSISKTWIFGALLAAVALAIALTFGASAPSAYAATGQAGDSLGAAQIALDTQSAALETQAATKAVKSCKFTTATKTLKKKALTVKKGTTKFKLKGESGVLKFKATKTKKYSFKFSGMTHKTQDDYGFCAYVTFLTPDKNSPKYSFDLDKKLATKGGKTETLWLASKSYKHTISGTKAVDKPIKTRTGTVKLKKGQVVYMYFSGGYKGVTASLKIK